MAERPPDEHFRKKLRLLLAVCSAGVAALKGTPVGNEPTNNPSALLRPADVRQHLNFKSLTSIWALVKSGELPEPIKIGLRAVAWQRHEIDTIIAARAGGATDDDVRHLVQQIHEARTKAWQRVRQTMHVSPQAAGGAA